MRYSGLVAGSALAAVARAHSTIWNVWANDVDQGIGNVAGGYIRYPPNNSPVKDITSSDMTCNVANTPNTKTITVNAGDKITLEWHHDTAAASDPPIAESHKGPLLAYMAPTSSNGAGDVWVKISEDGYDGTTWAVETLNANGGKWSFTIPSALADGDYLIRGEIIALHESDAAYNVNPARGAQFYMECVQVTVTGGGSTALPAGVAIPGAYSYSDPGVTFNLYGAFTSYTIPGPAVWDAASGSTTTPASSSKASVVSSSTAAPFVSSSVATSVTPISAPVATLAPVVSSPAAAEVTPAASSAPSYQYSNTTSSSTKKSKSACKSKSKSTTLPTLATSSIAIAAQITPTASVATPTTSAGAVVPSIYSADPFTSTGSSAPAPTSTGTATSSGVTEPEGTTLGDLISWISSFYTKHTTYTEATVARRHARALRV